MIVSFRSLNSQTELGTLEYYIIPRLEHPFLALTYFSLPTIPCENELLVELRYDWFYPAWIPFGTLELNDDLQGLFFPYLSMFMDLSNSYCPGPGSWLMAGNSFVNRDTFVPNGILLRKKYGEMVWV